MATPEETVGRLPSDVLAQAVLEGLQGALGSAMDNLPDVAGDPMFGNEATQACCADIAALAHLLANDANGRPNVLAYL